MVAAGGPEHLVPAGGPLAPVGPAAPAPGVARVAASGPEKPAAPIVPAAPDAVKRGGDITGQQLLDQAYVEFKAGEFKTAERLAKQAFNHGMQKEAAALLNSLDAEVHARKERDAERALANAKAAFDQKDYRRALGALVLIEPKLLPERARKSREEMLGGCRAELGKSGAGDLVATAGGVQPPEMAPLPPADQQPGGARPGNPPGTARVKSDDPPSAAEALRSVAFQKLRSEGLRVQEESQKAFGRGETDLAMQMLVDYGNRVRAAGLDPSSVARLLRPIEGRLDTFRMMKGQVDANARLNKEKRDAKELVTSRVSAEDERRREVAVLMRQCHDLVKKGEYAKAERVALQSKQLDPDEPAVTAMLEMVRLTRRVKEAEKDKSEKEKFFHYQMRDAEAVGPIVTADSPVTVQLQSLERSRLRGSLDNSHQRTRTPAEYEIELKLERPIAVEFSQTPLEQAIDNIKTLTGLPLVIDEASLTAEHISPVQPVTVKPGTSVATKNILAFTLEQVGLSYVVEHDMVKVTTVKKAKGRMVTKVFSVADLVTPVPNFALPDYANFDKMMGMTPLKSGNLVMSGLNAGGGSTPYSPRNGLGGGQPAGSALPGTAATTPGILAPSYAGGRGGTLETSPLAASSNVTSANNSRHEQLIKLITSMVRPYSWDGAGGAGKVEFFDIGNALVVNQTADVVSEVQDLLEALRRLQDLAVAVEIRVVSLAESFFERMGVDFSVNVQTHNTSFEPQLTQFNPQTFTNGVFRPYPYLNSLNGYKGVTVGLTPAGTFTPDLDVPIRATSFQRAVPGFGNYPNNPGNNGGISLGLAFLNDIQVYTFMELAQGDQRSNIMTAPKLTLFNGQTATLSTFNADFYVTNVQVVSVNGQIVFIPQNSPFPGAADTSVNITVQAVVSADRRFVRLNLPVTMAAQNGAAVPLFPVTTFVTPVFEGGSQGQPIPFTQFLQQPAFNIINISTTVVCPDGGTALLGGLKVLRESRNEFGPPFLSKIPYLNRLFKNVGVGRETRHVMIMVTPRIIINSEEEIFQTEGRLPGQAGTGP
jgi:type II secretory pathway component GspD/PulD (secretin)